MSTEAQYFGLLLDFQANAQRIDHLTACLTLSNSELAKLRQQEVSAPTKCPEPNTDVSSLVTPDLTSPVYMDPKAPSVLTRTPVGKSCRSPSLGNSQQYATRSWTPDEHERFLAAHAVHGRGWSAISAAIGTRTPKQVRTYAQRLERRSGKRLLGRPKGACASPSRAEARTCALKGIPASAPSSPVTPKISFAFGGVTVADETYREQSSAGAALSEVFPEIAPETDSIPFMSLLPSPLEDKSSLLRRPQSAELELPFGAHPGMSGGDEEVTWDDPRGVDPLSLQAFAVEPCDDYAL